MRKLYIKPQTDVLEVESVQSILAVSVQVGPGSTGKQYSREFILDEDCDILVKTMIFKNV